MLIPLLALTTMLSVHQPSGIRDTGDFLVDVCKDQLLVWDFPSKASDINVASAHGCYDYVRGFLDGSMNHCLNEVSMRTVITVYIAFMQKHPEFLQTYKGIGLKKSILEAYACSAESR